MTEIADDDLVTNQAGIEVGSSAYGALSSRADVMAMTQATHDAALTPADPGGLSHAVRAGLAARIARHGRDEALAGHYDALRAVAPAEEDAERIGDLTFSGAPGSRLAALIAYTDLVTLSPRDAAAADIEALQAAGISDPDIVRLAELNAFLAYQTRLIAGLKLMKAIR